MFDYIPVPALHRLLVARALESPFLRLTKELIQLGGVVGVPPLIVLIEVFTPVSSTRMTAKAGIHFISVITYCVAVPSGVAAAVVRFLNYLLTILLLIG
jgi:hypothetical protein